MDKETTWTINPEWERLGPEHDIHLVCSDLSAPPIQVGPAEIRMTHNGEFVTICRPRPNIALALLMLGCIGFWSAIAALTIWIY